MQEGKWEGHLCIKRRELVLEPNLRELLFGDGKDDCMNYRYGLSSGVLRGRIVFIRQSKEEDLMRGV